MALNRRQGLDWIEVVSIAAIGLGLGRIAYLFFYTELIHHPANAGWRRHRIRRHHVEDAVIDLTKR